MFLKRVKVIEYRRLSRLRFHDFELRLICFSKQAFFRDLWNSVFVSISNFIISIRNLLKLFAETGICTKSAFPSKYTFSFFTVRYRAGPVSSQSPWSVLPWFTWSVHGSAWKMRLFLVLFLLSQSIPSQNQVLHPVTYTKTSEKPVPIGPFLRSFGHPLDVVYWKTMRFYSGFISYFAATLIVSLSRTISGFPIQ